MNIPARTNILNPFLFQTTAILDWSVGEKFPCYSRNIVNNIMISFQFVFGLVSNNHLEIGTVFAKLSTTLLKYILPENKFAWRQTSFNQACLSRNESRWRSVSILPFPHPPLPLQKMSITAERAKSFLPSIWMKIEKRPKPSRCIKGSTEEKALYS